MTKIRSTLIMGTALLTLSTGVFAATISFNGSAAGSFVAKAAGINFSGGNISTGTKYTIAKDAQGRVVNTNVQLIGGGPTPPYKYAQGNIEWNAQGNNKYSVSISAGALYSGSDPSQCYTMMLSIDGKQVAQNTTLNHGAWSPTSVTASITPSSDIEVGLSSSNCR